jgi:hypothetical protein
VKHTVLALGAGAVASSAAAALAAAPVPTPIGFGPKFRLDAASPNVVRAAPVGRFACLRTGGPRELAHVELFANRLVLLVPAGVGMAPPLEREAAYISGARCSYAVRTRAPTGVVEFTASVRPTLGDLFAVWGQPLSARALAGFRGPVSAWVGGKRWPGDPRSIPLRRHAEIVVEVGGYVPPHAFFLFPRGS